MAGTGAHHGSLGHVQDAQNTKRTLAPLVARHDSSNLQHTRMHAPSRTTQAAGDAPVHADTYMDLNRARTYEVMHGKHALGFACVHAPTCTVCTNSRMGAGQ